MYGYSAMSPPLSFNQLAARANMPPLTQRTHRAAPEIPIVEDAGFGIHGTLNTMYQQPSTEAQQRRFLEQRRLHEALDQQRQAKITLERSDHSRESKEPQGTSLAGLGEGALYRGAAAPPAQAPQPYPAPSMFGSPQPRFDSFQPRQLQPPPQQQARPDVFQQHLAAQIEGKRRRRRERTPTGGGSYPYFSDRQAGSRAPQGNIPRPPSHGGRVARPAPSYEIPLHHSALQAPQRGYATYPAASHGGYGNGGYGAPPRGNAGYGAPPRNPQPDLRSVPRGDQPLVAMQGVTAAPGGGMLENLNGLYEQLRQQRERRMQDRWHASVVAEKHAFEQMV